MEGEGHKLRLIRKDICRDWEDDEKKEVGMMKMNNVKQFLWKDEKKHEKRQKAGVKY